MRHFIAAFAAPLRHELAVGFIAIAILIIVGRFVFLEGSTWNLFGLLATAVLFAMSGHKASAVKALDVPAKTWFTGFAVVAVVWSVVLGLLAVAATWLNWQTKPHYARSDAFFVTADPGTPLIVLRGQGQLGGGVGAISWSLTVLVLVTCFLAACAIGAALGAIATTWGAVVAIGTAAVAFGTSLAVVFSIFEAGYRIEAPYPGAFVFGLPAVAAAVIVLWFTANRLGP
ncbi:hypothetical protein ACFWGD_04170 [Corynebacterium sp. NPDC060344]|uniref:hypothetical protein n=1 Tax=Corynebacterium sp. NPDC060344 TaxID=3347101 RepID=UPI003659A5A1